MVLDPEAEIWIGTQIESESDILLLMKSQWACEHVILKEWTNHDFTTTSLRKHHANIFPVTFVEQHKIKTQVV